MTEDGGTASLAEEAEAIRASTRSAAEPVAKPVAKPRSSGRASRPRPTS